ncbi:MAG: hypothetical protein ACE361_07705 [Aureliella sp.]
MVASDYRNRSKMQTSDAKIDMVRSYSGSLRIIALLIALPACLAGRNDAAAQDSLVASGSENATNPIQAATSFLRSPSFKIPFDVDVHNGNLAEVQLWVSTDLGENWQMHGVKGPDHGQGNSFDFKAAAEGLYLFSVQTVDRAGNSFPSQTPPLRVFVDTSAPKSAMRADVNQQGQLVVDIRVADDNIVPASAELRARTDRDANWQQVRLGEFTKVGEILQSRTILDVPLCREIGLVFSVKDKAENQGEATFQYKMPRTATGPSDMTLASTPGAGPLSPRQPIRTAPQNQTRPTQSAVVQQRIPELNGAQAWVPSDPNAHSDGAANARNMQPAVDPRSVVSLSTPENGPGRLASNGLASNGLASGGLVSGGYTQPGGLALSGSNAASSQGYEELPLPAPNDNAPPATSGQQPDAAHKQALPHYTNRQSPPNSVMPQVPDQTMSSLDGQQKAHAERQAEPESAFGRAFHCKSRMFSLDYSVEALGGTTLSEIVLWGTQDGGRTWEAWDKDPDRQSPFDVEVGNDGLFGFRMVIVGANGLVSNQPKPGDAADVWINIDTSVPTAKITRAVYGEGPEDGMLVIDYSAGDGHLVEKPVTFSYSQSIDGPWQTIATNVKNSGIYLWKAGPNIPEHIYLKLDVIDKAGNIGTHRLDLPIDTKGLAPRGRIQGFRPIVN